MNDKPCTKKIVEVTSSVALCCPRENERVWDGHPRVYLEMDASEKVACPYCETEYVLCKKS